jgi:hypothetical protein
MHVIKGVVQVAEFVGIALTIDGVTHRFDLTKVEPRTGPMFTYYDFDVPEDWHQQSYLIP